MNRYYGNHTIERFPRASSDNPLRSPSAFAGPWRHPRAVLWDRLVEASAWVGGVGLLASLLYAPDIWRYFVGA